MEEYTKYNRGSEWRRWDLHIHTPGTLKNDQFIGSSLDEKWEKYVKDINDHQAQIAVIGITDYVSTDNYFKFKQYVLTNVITKSFDLIIPNIELRIHPVTGSSTPINIHCLFNPEIDDQIHSRFLSRLSVEYGHTTYSGTNLELIRLGRAFQNNQALDEQTARNIGAGQFVLSFDSLKKIFKEDRNLRDNTIIVVSNSSNDGASGLRHSDLFIGNTSQLDTTRQSIYQFSDAIFSSNESDINYFLGKGADSIEEVKRKCRTLKPCFHGSDAHINSKIFNPDENRFCWIKADPTFEGLKQTLYESESRVAIQFMPPEFKQPRNVISKIKFTGNDELFGNQEISLNDNLNAIIGGKSLLLYSIASSIDPAQVKSASEKLKFEGYKFESSYDFEVEWKDGVKDMLSTIDPEAKSRKITYIPQLFINYLAEKNNKEQLNELIRSILLQDSSFKDFFQKQVNGISTLNSEIEKQLALMIDLRTKVLNLSTQGKETGTSTSIAESIKKIEERIQSGKKASNLNDQEETEFDSLIMQKQTLDEQGRKLIDEAQLTTEVIQEFQAKRKELFGISDAAGILLEKGTIDRLIDKSTYASQVANVFKGIISDGFQIIGKNLDDEVGRQNIKSQLDQNKTAVSELVKKLEPFNEKLKNQKGIAALAISLDQEKSKLSTVLGIERQISVFIADYHASKTKMGDLLQQRINLYQSIVDYVNKYSNQIGEDIALTCSLKYQKEDFDFFYHVNKTAISGSHPFHHFFIDEVINYSLIPDFVRKVQRVGETELTLENDIKVPLNSKVQFKDIFEGLSKDAFHLDYAVTYKNDDLLSMSPGKKGTVLLILFLQLSSNEYPILIDQPEDNLDNRTIYELLCKIIREKKKHRQILIVSHNANLVVSTDAENIVVANQEGQDPNRRKSKFQFEYVNGSLEHSFPVNSKIQGVLFQQGIREHVCDILEGGNEAFKQRERKYSIK